MYGCRIAPASSGESDKVVPKLQKRGIFRHEDEGRSLQEKLGLPRRKNRFLEA